MSNDHDSDVPLDRDEEVARQIEGDEGSRDSVGELLLRTQLRALNPRPPLAVESGSSIADACALMRASKVGCVLVMSGDELTGIFTERDVLYKLTGTALDPAAVKIDELMTPKPTTLRPAHSLAHALNKMTLDGCRHIPLVNRAGRPVGVVSVRRIVDFLVDAFADQLQTLPDDPDQHERMDRPEGG